MTKTIDLDKILGRPVKSPFLDVQLNRSSRYGTYRDQDFLPDDPLRGGATDRRLSLADPRFQTTGAMAGSRLSEVAGKAEYLLDSLGPNATEEEKERLRAIIASGGYLAPEDKPGIISKAFQGLVKAVDAPRKLVAAGVADAFNIGEEFSYAEAARQILGGDPSTDPRKAEGLEQWRSEDGQLLFTGSQILQQAGWEKKEGESLLTKAARGTAGFALDFGVDPLSWISFGTLGLGKAAASSAARSGVLASTREAAEHLIRGGVVDDIVDPLSKKIGHVLVEDGRGIREAAAKKMADAESARLGRRLTDLELDEVTRRVNEEWYWRQVDQADILSQRSPVKRESAKEFDEFFGENVSPVSKMYSEIDELVTAKRFRDLEDLYPDLINSKNVAAYGKGGLTVTTPFMRKQAGGVSVGFRTNREVSKPIRVVAETLWEKLPYDKVRGPMESWWKRRSVEAAEMGVRAAKGAWSHDAAVGLARHAVREMQINDVPGILEASLRTLSSKAEELGVDPAETMEAMARLLDEGMVEGALERLVPHAALRETMQEAHDQIRFVMDTIHGALVKIDPDMGKIENYFPVLPSEQFTKTIESLAESGLSDKAARIIKDAFHHSDQLSSEQRFGLQLVSEFLGAIDNRRGAVAGATVDHTVHQNPRMLGKTLFSAVGGVPLGVLDIDAVTKLLYEGSQLGTKAGWATRVDMNKAVRAALELLAERGAFGRRGLKAIGEWDPFSMDLPQVLDSYVKATSNTIHFSTLIEQGKRVGLVGAVDEALEIGQTLAELTHKGPLSKANQRLLKATRAWLRGDSGKPTMKKVEVVDGWTVDLAEEIASDPRVVSALKRLREQADKATARTGEHLRVLEEEVSGLVARGLPEAVARDVVLGTADRAMLDAQAAIYQSMREQAAMLRSWVEAQTTKLSPDQRRELLREAADMAAEWGGQARRTISQLREQWADQFGFQRARDTGSVDLLAPLEDGTVPLAVLDRYISRAIDSQYDALLDRLPPSQQGMILSASSTGDMKLSVERAMREELQSDLVHQALLQAWDDVAAHVDVADLKFSDLVAEVGPSKAVELVRALDGFAEPRYTDDLLRDVADGFADRRGSSYWPRQVEDAGDVQGIRVEYDQLPDVDGDAMPAFERLYDETLDQVEELQRRGFRFVPTDMDQPYPSLTHQIKDIKENRRLMVPVKTAPVGGKLFYDPQWAVEGMPFGNLFDALHVVMGHAMHDFDGSLNGITSAWLAHGQLYSDAAREAFTTLTRGRRIAGRVDNQARPRKVALMDPSVASMSLARPSQFSAKLRERNFATALKYASNLEALQGRLRALEQERIVNWTEVPASAGSKGDPFSVRVVLKDGSTRDFATRDEFREWSQTQMRRTQKVEQEIDEATEEARELLNYWRRQLRLSSERGEETSILTDKFDSMSPKDKKFVADVRGERKRIRDANRDELRPENVAQGKVPFRSSYPNGEPSPGSDTVNDYISTTAEMETDAFRGSKESTPSLGGSGEKGPDFKVIEGEPAVPAKGAHIEAEDAAGAKREFSSPEQIDAHMERLRAKWKQMQTVARELSERLAEEMDDISLPELVSRRPFGLLDDGFQHPLFTDKDQKLHGLVAAALRKQGGLNVDPDVAARQVVERRLHEAEALAEGRGLSAIRDEDFHALGPSTNVLEEIRRAIVNGDSQVLARREAEVRELFERINLDPQRLRFDYHSDGTVSMRYVTGDLELEDFVIPPEGLRQTIGKWVPFPVEGMSTSQVVERTVKLIDQGVLSYDTFPPHVSNFLRRVPNGKMPIEAEDFDYLRGLLPQLTLARSKLLQQARGISPSQGMRAAEGLDEVLKLVEPFLRRRKGDLDQLDQVWEKHKDLLERVLPPDDFSRVAGLVELAPAVRQATALSRGMVGKNVLNRWRPVSEAFEAFDRARSEVMQEAFASGLSLEQADELAGGIDVLTHRLQLLAMRGRPSQLTGEAYDYATANERFMQATMDPFEIQAIEGALEDASAQGALVGRNVARLSENEDFQNYISRELGDLLPKDGQSIEDWLKARAKELSEPLKARRVPVATQARMVSPAVVGVGGRSLEGQKVDVAFAVLLESMASNIEAMFTPLGIKVLSDQLRGFERFWKGAVTVGRPTFVPRNVIGGVWNGMVADTGVREYAWLGSKARQIRRHMKSGMRFEDAMGKAGLSADDQAVFLAARDMGIFDTEFTSDIAEPLLGRAAKRSWNPMAGALGGDKSFVGFDLGGEFMQTSEDFMRMAVFKRWYDPQNPASAMFARDMVNAVHFDYANLTRLESRIKKFVPFFVWTRRNIPLQLRLAVERPGIWNRYANLQRNVETSFEDREYQFTDRQPIPGWMGTQAADTDIVIDRGEGLWTRILFSPDLPTRDLEQLIGRFSSGNPLAAALGFAGDMMSPTFSTPAELATNPDYFEGTTTPPTGLAAVLRSLNKVGLWWGETKGGEPQISYGTRDLFETAMPFLREWSEVAGIAPNDGMRAGDLGYRLDDGVSMEERALGAFLGIGKAVGIRGTTPHDTLGPAVEAEKLIKQIERAAIGDGRFGLGGAEGPPSEPANELLPAEWFAPGQWAAVNDAPVEPAQVVVDGDTIKLRLADGTYEQVRLLGINTPEAGEMGAHAAKVFLEDLLASGGQVRTVRDVVDSDAYGRKLRYVWVGDRMLNLELVRAGLAQPQSYYPNRAFEALLDG